MQICFGVNEMFKITTGNILESDADCLVNTVNCEGFMGKGIAYQFKLKFPNNNRDYVKACSSGSLKIGSIHFFRENGKLIVNLPTKDKWREKSKVDYITSGLRELSKLIQSENIKSIAIPPLGCGNGGLNWTEVKPIIMKYLLPFSENVEINIYEPSKNYTPQAIEVPKINASHLMLMKFKPKLNRFNKIRIQKSAYFMNLFSGERYFIFNKYKYGPYAHSIDILIKDIKQFQRHYNVDTMEAFKIAKTVLISDSIEKKLNYFEVYIDEAAKFVNFIKTDTELELLSTICSILEDSFGLSDREIIESIKSWSVEKALKFNEDQIESGIDLLVQKDILRKDILNLYRLQERANSFK